MPVPLRVPHPLQDADLCVQCGLCLPHCPTYRVTRDENESPRGRIQLMRAYARGQLPLTPRFEGHLDRCLACRACETVCPARVPFGTLLDATRALIVSSRGRSRRRRLMDLVARPARLAAALRLARLYQRSGLRFLARGAGVLSVLGLKRLDTALPELPRLHAWKPYYPADGRARGEVSLFLGCVARTFDQETIDAAIFVLNRYGYGVHVPDGQTCCGALHGHAGDPATAQDLAHDNRRAFAGTPGPALFLASGCGATLIEYQPSFAARDFCEFLAAIPDTPFPRVDPPLRVAVHMPCTQRNVLRNTDSVFALLRRVAGLDVLPLEENNVCCGGAGTYFLDQPAIADRLRDDKLSAIERAGTRTVLTTNIGCALHLRAGLRGRVPGVEVIHPAVLLRRTIETRAPAGTTT